MSLLVAHGGPLSSRSDGVRHRGVSRRAQEKDGRQPLDRAVDYEAEITEDWRRRMSLLTKVISTDIEAR